MAEGFSELLHRAVMKTSFGQILRLVTSSRRKLTMQAMTGRIRAAIEPGLRRNWTSSFLLFRTSILRLLAAPRPRSGHYEIDRTDRRLTLTNRLSVQGFRSEKKADLEITKSVSTALNPLRHDAAIQNGALEYAGHTLVTSLRIVGANPNDAPLVASGV